MFFEIAVGLMLIVGRVAILTSMQAGVVGADVYALHTSTGLTLT